MNELYQKELQMIYEQRSSNNPRYSLRAFARDLEMDPSDLVNIMKGKKSVSPRVAYKIGQHLNLTGEKLLAFLVPTLN
jgi:plasmid maintenance system antidote protein VapI